MLRAALILSFVSIVLADGDHGGSYGTASSDTGSTSNGGEPPRCMPFKSLQDIIMGCMVEDYHGIVIDQREGDPPALGVETSQLAGMVGYSGINNAGAENRAESDNNRETPQRPQTNTSAIYVIHVEEYVKMLRLMCEDNMKKFEQEDMFMRCVGVKLAWCTSEDLRTGLEIADHYRSALVCPNLEKKIEVILAAFAQTGIFITPHPPVVIAGGPVPLSGCLDHATWRMERKLWIMECDAVYNVALEQVDPLRWTNYQAQLTAANNMRISCIRRLLRQNDNCDEQTQGNVLKTTAYLTSIPGVGYIDERILVPDYVPRDNDNTLCHKRFTLAIWSLQYVRSVFGQAQYCPKFAAVNATILSTDRMLIVGRLEGTSRALSELMVIYYVPGTRRVHAVYKVATDPMANFRCDDDWSREQCKKKRSSLRDDLADDEDRDDFADGVELYSKFLGGEKKLDNGQLRIKRMSVPGKQQSIDIYDEIGQTVVSITWSYGIHPRLNLVVSAPDYVIASSHGVLVSGCPVETVENHRQHVFDLMRKYSDSPKKLTKKCTDHWCNALVGNTFNYNSCLDMCFTDEDEELAYDVVKFWIVLRRFGPFANLCHINSWTTPISAAVSPAGTALSLALASLLLF